MMTRADALALLHEFTASDSLRKHALAVEAVMRASAVRAGGDPEAWGLAGLLHDFDYERFPAFPDHPTKGSEILLERGVDEAVRTAILGHVPALGVPRTTPMAKSLFACDELSGFVVACAMVRPAKFDDLGVSSVKKKMKDKAFARGVSRDDIVQGAAELGIPLDEQISFVIDALRPLSALLLHSEL
jgi:putative nucleotidyltransferase with HDIG domain